MRVLLDCWWCMGCLMCRCHGRIPFCWCSERLVVPTPNAYGTVIAPHDRFEVFARGGDTLAVGSPEGRPLGFILRLRRRGLRHNVFGLLPSFSGNSIRCGL